MRVLIVSSSYHPVLGGLQTVTRQVAVSLQESGHQVRVFTNRHPRSLPAQELLDGIPVERRLMLGSSGSGNRLRRADVTLASLWYNPAARSRLARLIGEFRPDVVNVHFPEPRVVSLMATLPRRSLRLVVSLHGDDIERWSQAGVLPRGQRDLDNLRAFLRSADSVTACSRFLLERAAGLEPSVSGKAHVIHNGIDLSRFESHEAYSHPRPYLLAYGRHTRKKGFDLLLKAFAGVAQRESGLDLILAGEGEQTPELKAMCRELGLDGRVVFYGAAQPAEVVRLLNGCRVAVIPSRQEPFGIVAVEALCCGHPTVITRAGGLPEVVAAVKKSRSGSPAVYWAEPDSLDLERAMLRALLEPEPMPVVAGPYKLPEFALARMTRAYQSVLENSGVEDSGVEVSVADPVLSVAAS